MTTSLRTDKKCGNSNIPDDKQCKAGGGIGRKIATGAAIAGGAALAAYGGSKLLSNTSGGRLIRRKASSFGRQANTSINNTMRTASVVARRKATTFGRAASATAGRASRTATVVARRRGSQLGRAAGSAATSAGESLNRGMRVASVSARRTMRSAFRRNEADSVWAAGFDPTDY